MRPQKILIIDGHPDAARERLCHALAEAYAEGALEAGNEIRLITLAETDVKFLRTAAEFAEPPASPGVISAQKDVAWADHVVMVFPLWLGGAPALLRALLEQIACGSFFAKSGGGSGNRKDLKNKSARLIVTMGMPAFVYRLVFHAHGVKNIMGGVLGFAGFKPVRATLFGAVEAADDAKRKSWIGKVRELGRRAR